MITTTRCIFRTKCIFQIQSDHFAAMRHIIRTSHEQRRRCSQFSPPESYLISSEGSCQRRESFAFGTSTGYDVTIGRNSVYSVEGLPTESHRISDCSPLHQEPQRRVSQTLYTPRRSTDRTCKVSDKTDDIRTGDVLGLIGFVISFCLLILILSYCIKRWSSWLINTS